MHCSNLSKSIVAFAILLAPLAACAQETQPAHSKSEDTKLAHEKNLLKSLVGKWEGNVRTWFEPEKLADESKVTGEFTAMIDGKYVRHSYTGSMQGKPRMGEETIVYNPAQEDWQVSWFDDFHMNYGLLFSEGKSIENGFSVFGKWSVGADQPKWGWRTDYVMHDADNLTITAYNVTPDGEEAKGVETVYRRVK